MKTASLSSALLARKGTAGPSHLRAVEAHDEPAENPASPVKTLTDIRLAESSRPTVVHEHDEAKESGRRRPLRTISIRKPGSAASKTDRTARVKMSLRLEPARYKRLRLAAANNRRHMQDIMATALERYLDALEAEPAAPAPSATPSNTPAPDDSKK